MSTVEWTNEQFLSSTIYQGKESKHLARVFLFSWNQRGGTLWILYDNYIHSFFSSQNWPGGWVIHRFHQSAIIRSTSRTSIWSTPIIGCKRQDIKNPDLAHAIFLFPHRIRYFVKDIFQYIVPRYFHFYEPPKATKLAKLAEWAGKGWNAMFVLWTTTTAVFSILTGFLL